MSLWPLDQIRQLKDANFHPGVDASMLAKFEIEHGFVLPNDHRIALHESNGMEVYAGYIRLFGVCTTQSTDAILWNQPDYWKFAWGERCFGYWCFGETAWGDQYAYTLDSLRSNETAKVYFLDALSMTSQVVASSFREFMEKELVRSARDPYDGMIKQARQKLGPLEVTSHLAYVPSILLGGSEDISRVQKMNARASMISNGDIAIQLDAGPPHKAVKGVQPYEDESHRMRLRLIWM